MKPDRHYDAVMREARRRHASDAEALAARAKGLAAPLKRFHNAIKRSLISRSLRLPGARVLDLACGRGGDVHKWIDARAASVTGLDVSAEEIAEARRRVHVAIAGECAPPTFEYIVGDMTTFEPTQKAYSLVSCMFALHYAGDKLGDVLDRVVAALQPGGRFIGTMPDPEAILNLLGGANEYLSPALRIERRGADRILFELRDTVTQSVDGVDEGSEEHLVSIPTLEREASKRGLVRERIGSLNGAVHPSTGRFLPTFGTHAIPGLEIASGLFVAFSFTYA
jgi:SAM-dependent methyltransferase